MNFIRFFITIKDLPHHHLKRKSLITITVLISLISPLQLAAAVKDSTGTLAQAQTQQNSKAKADKLFELGVQQYRKGQLQQAGQTYQQVLKIRQELGDKAGVGQTLNNIGEVHNALSQHSQALEILQQALAIRREVKDRAGEGETLDNIGLVYGGLEQYPKALEILQQALAIRKEVRDKTGEGKTLSKIGFVYAGQKQYPKALEVLQQALALNKEVGDNFQQAKTLRYLGAVYNESGKYPDALKFLEQALALNKEVGDRADEGITLVQIGRVYTNQKLYPKALELFQQALAINKEVGDRTEEMKTLGNITLVYQNQGKYSRAIETAQQVLTIAKLIKNRKFEWAGLGLLIGIYAKQNEYQKAVELSGQALAIAQEIKNPEFEKVSAQAFGGFLVILGMYNLFERDPHPQKTVELVEQGLAIARKIKNPELEGLALATLSLVYNVQGESQKAIEVAQSGLAIARKIKKPLAEEAEQLSLFALGQAYIQLGELHKASQFLQQGLSIARATKKNPSLEFGFLAVLSSAYNLMGEYHKALELAQASLASAQKIKALYAESAALGALASAYSSLKEYQKALESAQTNLKIAQESKSPWLQMNSSLVLMRVYIGLGDNQKVIDSIQQTLPFVRQINNRDLEAMLLAGLGAYYFLEGDSQKAINFSEQGLSLAQKNKNPVAQSVTLGLLGEIYGGMGKYEKAIKFSQQALEIVRKLQDRNLESSVLTALGTIYRKAGQKEQAIKAYQKALEIDTKLGVPSEGASVQAGLARIYRDMNMPTTAITYYKQAIDGIEKIRGNIRGLPPALQETFLQASRYIDRTRNVDIYRELADLLLKLGRVAEAQQVLELLKIEELRNFTRTATEKPQIPLNQSEEEIKKAQGTLIAFGQRVYECEQKNCSQLKELRNQRDNLNREIVQNIREIEKGIVPSVDPNLIYPGNFNDAAQSVIKAQPGTVLIYPLVLEDKVWILWASQGVIFKSVEVKGVGQRQLGETVSKFRKLLENKSSDIAEVKATGKQLYDWLIKPLEPEIKVNKIQNLVFALDRSTRYIPISALFDGEKYLVENYNVSTVISAGLTNMSDRLPSSAQNSPVLALGLSNAVAGFNALPNVPEELDAIVRKSPSDKKGIYPGLEFLNVAFDFLALRDNLSGKKILHIATHGAFLPNNPYGSYLLSGTGNKIPISEIQLLQNLGDIHLVVLSACETALGGPNQDGIEISGISSYFLGNSKAKAVMASLWKVSDSSTSQLMQLFYNNLASSNPSMTKAQALRQAQLSLLYGKQTVNSEQGRGIVEVIPVQPNLTPTTNLNYSHPYYWAPFILIGNGL